MPSGEKAEPAGTADSTPGTCRLFIAQRQCRQRKLLARLHAERDHVASRPRFWTCCVPGPVFVSRSALPPVSARCLKIATSPSRSDWTRCQLTFRRPHRKSIAAAKRQFSHSRGSGQIVSPDIRVFPILYANRNVLAIRRYPREAVRSRRRVHHLHLAGTINRRQGERPFTGRCRPRDYRAT